MAVRSTERLVVMAKSIVRGRYGPCGSDGRMGLEKGV